MVSDVKGAILAAGTGDRLRQAVGGLPKPLVEVGGEPLIVRQARALRRAGANPVYAVVNSETARVAQSRAIEIPQWLRLSVRDTASSMESLFALGAMVGAGRVLLATVDSLVPQTELDRFTALALGGTDSGAKPPADGALAVVRWRGDRRPLFARVDPDGLITALGSGNSPLVTAGLYLFSTRIFEFAATARARGLDALRRFLAMLLEEGLRLSAIEIKDAIDIDEGADLEAARAMIALRAEADR